MNSNGSPSETLGALLPSITEQLEVAIAAGFGRRPGAPTALEGRCLLASSAAAECLRRRGWPAQLATGTLHVDKPGVPGLDLAFHAWVLVADRLLFDPTAIQFERPRWNARMTNVGAGLMLVLPEKGCPYGNLGHWQDTSGVQLRYQPGTRAEARRAARAPDAQESRWRPLADAVLASLDLGTPVGSFAPDAVTGDPSPESL